MRILIADDHPVVRKGLRQLLEEFDTGKDIQIEEAGNGKEVIDQVSTLPFDVVLLDISMPGRSGLDIIPDIKKIQPRVAILILSIYKEEQYAVRAFKSGASGYLTKDTAPSELMSAIHRVFSGERYISPGMAENIVFNSIDDKEKSSYDILSERELEVMIMLASGKTITGIATELSLSPKTISTYRERIMNKLGLKTTSEIIRYAINKGLDNQ